MSEATARQIVDHFLSAAEIPSGPPCNCPYLPGRSARHRAFLAEQLDPEIYHALMDRRFRRSGNLIYQPDCEGCAECVQLRLRVGEFSPSRSQRRVWRTNQDLVARMGPPELTAAKWRIYADYLEQQHDGTMSAAYEDLYNFLYRSPVDTLEITYHLDEVLVGVSIVDRAPRAFSSVYMFFDPRHARRSPGTYSMLWEIDYCRRAGIPYYYLGFYVKDCSKMSYKANFRPNEQLDGDGQWVRCPA